MRTLALCVVFSVLAVGCSKPSPEANVPEAKSPDAQSSNPNSTADATNPGGATNSDPNAKTSPDVKANDPAAARKAALQIPAPQTRDWKSAEKMTPKLLAQKVGEAMKNLKNTYGEATTIIETPEGNGTVKSRIQVVDAKHYQIEFPVIERIPKSGEVRSDGKLRLIRSGSGLEPQKPATWVDPKSNRSGTELATTFSKEFPRSMFYGLTDGKDAWKSIGESWSNGGNNSVRIEERTMEAQGRKFRHYRLYVSRTPAAEKKLGKMTMEIVIDAERYLPVTVRMNEAAPGGKAFKVNWSTGWRFNEKIDPSNFRIVPPSKGS